MLENPDATILLCALPTGELAGCVYLLKQGNQLYLGMLTVDPGIQGGGIGKGILQEAEAYALSIDCDRVVMTVITVRTELIQWYERRGYRSTGEKRPFPDDPRFGIPKQPLEFVVMEKKLDPSQPI
jgi:GNAT superfamily N-acetyltransferase